jgi:hypothetical protein
MSALLPLIAALAPQSGPLAAGLMLAALTAARLVALFATPQSVVPAPAAGLAVIPRRVMIYKPAGTAYAAVAAGEDLVLKCMTQLQQN